MKKYAWILSLLFGLSLLFVGRGDVSADNHGWIVDNHGWPAKKLGWIAKKHGWRIKVGQFLDSPVAGLYYYPHPRIALLTGENGEFAYKPHKKVRFFVGDPDIGAIYLGKTAGGAIVTPCDLTGAADELDAETTNIAILLQSLDADGNPDNGIEITAAISAVVETFIAGGGGPINFDQDPNAFVADPALVALFAALIDAEAFDEGGGEIRTPVLAQRHLNATLNQDATTVTTDSGDVVGYIETTETADENNPISTKVWRGIPFAAPPVGELRWKAPADPAPWTNPLYATENPEVCSQIELNRYWQPTAIPPADPNFIGSEDCLYLNVFRPDNNDIDLPVYFWIHGGNNVTGGAYMHEGHELANELNAVVVVTQYRMGPMGFWHDANLPADNDLDASGNYAALDHVKALTWVQNNIVGFGGDPENVTLAGQSAGGHNVLMMLISPLAEGLFDKLVSQSAGPENQPAENGQAAADATLAALLAADPDVTDEEAEIITTVPAERDAYLRSKTYAELRTAQDSLGAWGTVLYNSYVDGTVLEQSLISAIMAGEYNQVPIMIGANEHEMKPFQPLFPVPTTVAGVFGGPSWLWVHSILQGVPGVTMETVFPTQADLDYYDATGTIGSRNWRAKCVDEVADQLIAHQPDSTWAYLFTYGKEGSGPEPFDFLIGAGHGMEGPFFWGQAWDDTVFGYDAINDPNDPDYNQPGRADLSAKMMAYLGNFMYSGNPNGDEPDSNGLISWPAWSTGADPKLMVFGADKDQALLSISDEHLTVAGTWFEAFSYHVLNEVPDYYYFEPEVPYMYWFMWFGPAPELTP